ncbi:MAG: hypothetical protein WKF30_03755 [Pyrinomonadaceae bacterium]
MAAAQRATDDRPGGQLSDADLCEALRRALRHAEEVLSEKPEASHPQQSIGFDANAFAFFVDWRMSVANRSH